MCADALCSRVWFSQWACVLLSVIAIAFILSVFAFCACEIGIINVVIEFTHRGPVKGWEVVKWCHEVDLKLMTLR